MEKLLYLARSEHTKLQTVFWEDWWFRWTTAQHSTCFLTQRIISHMIGMSICQKSRAGGTLWQGWQTPTNPCEQERSQTEWLVSSCGAAVLTGLSNTARTLLPVGEVQDSTYWQMFLMEQQPWSHWSQWQATKSQPPLLLPWPCTLTSLGNVMHISVLSSISSFHIGLPGYTGHNAK